MLSQCILCMPHYLNSDPDLEVDGVLWMERTDGVRSIWRTKLRVVSVRQQSDGTKIYDMVEEVT